MSDGVTGDWNVIQRVRVAVGGMARGARPRLLRVVGVAAWRELAAGFDRAADPSGAAWAPTRAGGQPLAGYDRHWTLRFTGNGAQLASDHPGARIHQKGGVIFPKRGGVGRDAKGKFTRGRLGVLAFMVGGKKVFAKKVKIPARRMTPRNGTLEAWAAPIAAAVDAELTAMWEGR
jgi:hypothetical protein